MELIGALLVLVSAGVVFWNVISWDLEQSKKAREYQEKLNQDLNEAIGSLSRKNQELRKNQEHCDPNESWADSYRRDV